MKSVVSAKKITVFFCCSLLLAGCQFEKPQKTSQLTVRGAYSAKLSQDGQLIAVGSIEHGGSLWRSQPLDRLYNWNHRKGQTTTIEHIAFSPDSLFAATADNRTISLWNTKSGEPIWLWNSPSDINDIALSKQASLAVLGMKNYSVTLFDIQNGGIKRSFQHQGQVFDVSLDDKSRFAASGSYDNSAKVWSLANNKLLRDFPHQNPVRLSQLSGDASYLFTSAENEDGYIWQLKSGKKIAQLKNKRGYFTAARFKGKYLLTGNTAGYVQMWKVGKKEPLKQWKVEPRNPWVYKTLPVMDVAFGRGKTVYATANGLLYEFKR